MTETQNGGAMPLAMLPTQCDRSGKTVNVKVHPDEIKGYIEGIEARKRNGTALLQSLAQIPKGQMPDLIVVFKGVAVVHPTIPENAKQDLAIRRALNAALGADDERKFFDVPAPTARSSKDTTPTTSNSADHGADEAVS
jgi:hypothetical protein